VCFGAILIAAGVAAATVVCATGAAAEVEMEECLTFDLTMCAAGAT
jgi:hypothetical protein